MERQNKIDYTDKLIMAPMVRVGTLPSRLLALDNGADLVYTEEIIDFKMLQTTRIENEVLGTVDYVSKDGGVPLRTCSKEKGKVVFQIGTANAQRALKVAKLIEHDVAAIDVNMGCPKEFSIKGGMGAALLTQPEKVQDILTTLVKGVSIPVTCKIRLLPEVEDTIKLVKLIESCGVAAIGIHGRRKEERPRHPNHNDIIKTISEHTNLPIIANGGSIEVKCYEDIFKFKEATGADAVMLARAAMWNPSIFSKDGLKDINTLCVDYLKYAVDYSNTVCNVKYNMQQYLHEVLDTPRGRALQAAATVKEICKLWDLSSYYEEVTVKQQQKALHMKRKTESKLVENNIMESVSKKRKLEDGTTIYEMPFIYVKKEYSDKLTAKMVLYQYTKDNNLPKPVYDVEHNPINQLYHAVLTFDGQKYASIYWDKSKKLTEQAAAVVCCRTLGFNDGHKDGPDHYKKMKKLSNNDEKDKHEHESDMQGGNETDRSEDSQTKSVNGAKEYPEKMDTSNEESRTLGLNHDVVS